MKYLYFFYFLLTSFLVSSQTNDSLVILNEKEFISIVKKFHPVSKQILLIGKEARGRILSARGQFDPVISAETDAKQFQDKQYYALLNAEMVIPSWYGLEFKGGYALSKGKFLNQQEILPDNGLGSIGVSWQALQGFLMDDRRAAIKRAALFQQYTIDQQLVRMNELLFDAWNTYWLWATAYYQKEIFDDAVKVAKSRFDFVKTSFLLGDFAAIDTIEAQIQLQNRQLEQNQADIELQKARFLLSNYLWLENDIPVDLSTTVRPPSQDAIEIGTTGFDEYRNQIQVRVQDNPILKLYDYKLSDLSVERRLKLEKLKPKLKLSYSLLGTQFDILENRENSGLVIPQNYKWQANFGFPLFLRSARGDLQLQDVKINQAEYERNLKNLELTNKIKSYFAQLDNNIDQLSLFDKTLSNYRTLFNAESQKLDIGESSLFLVNSRENKLIEAKVKKVELILKNKMTAAELSWALGDIGILTKVK